MMTPAFKGILLMTAGISFLSIMDAMVKWMMLRGISPLQLIAVRGWLIIITILIALSLVPWLGGFRALKTRRLKHHFGRSLVGVLAPVMFFFALKVMPLADAVTIFFCTTFIMVAGSVLFLKEQAGIHRWSAVSVGFIGVVVAMQPGTSAFHPASLLVLVAASAYALILVSGRWLSETESSLQLIFYFTLFNTLICSVALLMIWPGLWRPMVKQEIYLIGVIAAAALAGYVFLTRAFTLAPISVIAPIEYLALFWAVLTGYLIWGDVPTPLVWLGIVLILGAGLYIGYRESRIKIIATTRPVAARSGQNTQPNHPT